MIYTVETRLTVTLCYTSSVNVKKNFNEVMLNIVTIKHLKKNYNINAINEINIAITNKLNSIFSMVLFLLLATYYVLLLFYYLYP